MFYHVVNLCPSHPVDMGGCGFSIQLWPDWLKAVENSEMTQDTVDNAINNMGRSWLDGCKFATMFDPDNCGFDADSKKPLGPNARPLYVPGHDLRVTWGKWGPEHITVPGNACGLDIDVDGFGSPRDGACLNPHNVDSVNQAHLILVVFTWFAGVVICDYEKFD